MKRTINSSMGRFRLGLISGAVLLVAGTAAAYNPAHNNILLRDAGSNIIAPGSTKAFSMKNTCGACHNGSTIAPSTGKALQSYDQIERHSYHAQLAANEQRGWNSWNPDDSKDPVVSGAGPQGKNWVQGPGHVGAW
ncbi:cytochrome c, 1 heme-binding site [Geotalea daltonii FRC-32]|uniref:Cytochrome c, 1 heme-binding site n=1 Tax=Geotalea daltonii (strain DSM 22248 / JCM 15807 / FRC-32) TaxID=316067 RepID=B9M6N4_GEODF|nr:hypothetical protein [Geotalea daltonii]ACM20094.1 cytochrome c, 1 heme-binding site [Geotalea daltonii FRC-32]